ncbi:MAG: carbon-nitrogen hydrolase family protein [Actinomycetota bacterium]|nr:carbon-nitrogen hydrolase family protein [Actinomycetota bacterium]
MRALAGELDIFVAYGFPERASGSAVVFDSANLVGSEGVLATYRKRNLVRTTPEHYVFGAGRWLPVVEAGGVRVSLVICWDLGFPEVAREAALGGADLILAPAAWREPWGQQYDLSCAARALDSGVFVASANQIDVYGEALFATPGHVYGPDGLRASHSAGPRSTCNLDPSAPGRWQGLYGNTFIDDFQAAVADEEPLEACS